MTIRFRILMLAAVVEVEAAADPAEAQAADVAPVPSDLETPAGVEPAPPTVRCPCGAPRTLPGPFGLVFESEVRRG